MGFFSNIGHKLTHHVKRHGLGWLTGGLADKTVHRYHKSWLNGSNFKPKNWKRNVGKYLGNTPRSYQPYTYVAPTSANTYQYQARPIASLMRS